jgi:transcriptional regulator
MIEHETKLRIVELRAKGTSIQKIASTLGIAKQTVVDVCKELKEEVALHKALRLDELYESESLSVEARVKRLSSLLGKLQAELESRSLAEIPTEKLIDLILRTQKELEEAKVEPIFKSSQEQAEEKEAREALKSLL